MKKGLIAGAILGISLSLLAPLAYSMTNIETLSKLSGISVETIEQDLEAGIHPREWAELNGVYEAFRETRDARREAVLQRRIDEGKLTEAEAEEYREAWNARSEFCTGDASGANPLQFNMMRGNRTRRNP